MTCGHSPGLEAATPMQRAIPFAFLLLAAGSQVLGCAHRSLTTADLPRLHKLQAEGGSRALQALDINGDQTLDDADVAIFSQLAHAAHAALGSRVVGVQVKLYTGADKDQPEVFSLVALDDQGAVDLTGVPPQRLEELAVEARWAASQLKLLGAAGVSQPAPGEAFSGTLRRTLLGYRSDRMAPKALCSAVEQLDLAPYQAAGVVPSAILDLDSTVWQGNVTDAFLAALTHSNLPTDEARATLGRLLNTVVGIDGAAVARNTLAQNGQLLLRHLSKEVPEESRVSAKDGFYTTVTMLKGLSVKQVEELAATAYTKGAGGMPPWSTRVFSSSDGCGMLDLIAALKMKGFRIYLLSATLDPLARMAADVLNVPAALALGSLLQVRDGVYTGEVKDSTYYAKGAIVRQWLPGPPLLAFGDSPRSDFSMLREAATAAFMINARAEFLERDNNEADSRFVEVEFDGIVGQGR